MQRIQFLESIRKKQSEGRFRIIDISEGAMELERLRAEGQIYGKDYIDSEIYQILKSEKNIAFFYGICYMKAIRKILMASKTFSDEFVTWERMSFLRQDIIEQERMWLILEFSDLFCYSTQLTKEGINYLQYIKKKLCPKCKCISVPPIAFSAFYPQEYGQLTQMNRYCVVSSKTRFATFYESDENINSLLDQGMKAGQIKKIVTDVNFYTKDFLEQNLEKEFRKICLQERFSDVKIMDFIKKNYKDKRLFLNSSHVSNPVLIEMARQILSLLGYVQELPKNIEAQNIFCCSELPVYPAVAQHLELSPYLSNPKFSLFTFANNKEVTFDEYIELYTEFCCDMKRYIEMGFFPEENNCGAELT